MGLISKLKAFFSKIYRKPEKPPQISLTQHHSPHSIKQVYTPVKSEVPVVKVESPPPSLETEAVEVNQRVITPLKIEPEAKTEIQLLYEEYENLSKEKENIRREMAELDRRLAAGELNPRERDRLFREKMVKVVGIAQRILEIRARCAELGKPIE